MGSLVRASRSERFIGALNDMAIKHMGLKSDAVVSQSLGYHDSMEQVFFFVNINTDTTPVELVYPDPVFDPENPDEENILGIVCSLFQLDDNAEIKKILKEADVIDGE